MTKCLQTKPQHYASCKEFIQIENKKTKGSYTYIRIMRLSVKHHDTGQAWLLCNDGSNNSSKVHKNFMV